MEVTEVMILKMLLRYDGLLIRGHHPDMKADIQNKTCVSCLLLNALNGVPTISDGTSWT